MSAELKSCPFCGETKDLTIVKGTDDYERYRALCGECLASSAKCWDEELAIEAWNTRAEPSGEYVRVDALLSEKVVREVSSKQVPHSGFEAQGLDDAIKMVPEGWKWWIRSRHDEPHKLLFRASVWLPGMENEQVFSSDETPAEALLNAIKLVTG